MLEEQGGGVQSDAGVCMGDRRKMWFTKMGASGGEEMAQG